MVLRPVGRVGQAIRSIENENHNQRALALATADRLYYHRGVRAVGMRELRAESGIPHKRMYELFPSKLAIVEEVLHVRHGLWMEGLTAAVGAENEHRKRLLAVYDFVADASAEAQDRGSIFINFFGELGGTSPSVHRLVREHIAAFQDFVAKLATEAGASPDLAQQLVILAEGTLAAAAVSGDPAIAGRARAAAQVLIEAALKPARGGLEA